MAFDLKKLAVRSFSGVVYVGIIVGGLLLGGDVFRWVVTLLCALAAIEFIKITQTLERRRIWYIALDVASCIFMSQNFLLATMICILLRFVSELYSKDPEPIRRLSLSALTLLYVGMPFAFMQLINVYLSQTLFLLGIFIMIWLSDTGAFIVGSLIGRHRLFERISPKKSWEGFWGGFAFNIAVALFFCYCPSFLRMQSASQIFGNGIAFWLGLSVVVTLFSTWGDLVESLIKRTLHIKDSGNIIPGHGGILDRVDSILLVMPAVAIYMLCCMSM